MINNALWIPKRAVELQLRLCVEAHGRSAGHRAYEATLGAIKEYVAWTTMAKDVKVFVQNCLHCVATIPGHQCQSSPTTFHVRTSFCPCQTPYCWRRRVRFLQSCVQNCGCRRCCFFQCFSCRSRQSSYVSQHDSARRMRQPFLSIILPLGPISRNINVDDNNCLLVGSLPNLILHDVFASRHMHTSMF
jgi:hypothetical protein